MVDVVVDTKTLNYYVTPTEEEPQYNIVHLPIATNNFELKPYLIGMVQQNQFFGLPSENSGFHLSIFVHNCGTVKANGVDQNAIRLSLFHFSLRDHVLAWLQFLPTNSITFRTQLKVAFLV